MSVLATTAIDPAAEVDAIFSRAKAAQSTFERTGSQALYDRAVKAAAWAVMEPGRNQELSNLAVETTELGNAADKVIKNHRKTLGLLRDLEGAKTFGVVREIPEKGLTEIARPKGVIGAITPSTNPVATPLNNMINALKGGNAIILSPSPKGIPACAKMLEYVHAEFAKAGIDPDLVQMVPSPSTKEKTQRLMEIADLVVVTGSQDNVRRAYSCGTPALGVGAGNVAVIVDETADLAAAAAKIAASKCFDNATSCSSENSLILVDAVYDPMMAALEAEGGCLLEPSEADKLKAALFGGGNLNRHMIAKDIDLVIKAADLEVKDASKTRFLMLPASGIGKEHPESGEKLSLVISLYRARDFGDAKKVAERLLRHQGAGHSLGLHSTSDERARTLGAEMPVCRVIVNQAHCFATGGSFTNGLPFSLSMGCGSWGGNSIDDNLNYRHFLNTTLVARPIPSNEPEVDELLADYWQEFGR